jgi:hypothetical protein
MNTETFEKIKTMLAFNPDSGTFVWKVGPSRSVNKGDMAGTVDHYGYVVIRVMGVRYKAHRLAWMICHGASSCDGLEIDHLNGQRSDNRITNLRAVTRAQNQQNQRSPHKDSRTGLLGIYKVAGRSMWRASISKGRTTVRLGYFGTPGAAHSAYVQAKHQLHPFSTIEKVNEKSPRPVKDGG